MSEPTDDPTDDPTGTTTGPTGAATGAVNALQVALAAEHGAVFVYGALGAQTSQSRQPTLFGALTRAYALHRDRRDHLTGVIVAAGGEPVAAEPGYALPADLGSPAAVKVRARALEESAASTYAYLVANTSGPDRAWAVQALLDAAVRGLGFGGKPERLPGL